jgi:ssDNA-binding replication factor A large subunit
MVVSHFEALDETLLLLSEARERAERAAQEVRADEGQEHIAEALERVDRKLLAMHRRLMDETYFYVPASPVKQLELGAA